MQKSYNYSVQSDDKPKFSLAEPVEETKNLIAVHNLSAEKLDGNLELGGIPMPSIAVTKADIGHTDFGDITLLFRKDTIDPELSKYNKLYGGDAYTPMFPTVDYEVNKNVVNKIRNKYSELSSKYGDNAARALYKYSDPSNTEDTLNFEKGKKGVISNAKNDVNLMQTFLYDKGIGEIATVEKKTTTQINEATVKQYDYFIEKLGKSAFEDLARRDPGTSVFNEVEAVVVPNDIDNDFVQKLKNHGLNVVKYNEDSDSRINTVNEVANNLDVKFSLADNSDSIVNYTDEEAQKITRSAKSYINYVEGKDITLPAY